MKDSLVSLLCLLIFVTDCFSAPALISQVGESFDENSINNDTNPDPCYISGSIYYHGQQISRQDECEFCLCVDGEMFCYWQCPEDEEEGGEEMRTGSPSKVANSTPPSSSLASSSSESTLISTLQSSTESSLWNNSLPDDRIEPTSPRIPVIASTSNEMSRGQAPQNRTTLAESSTATSASVKPVSCFVLGVEYKLGEILPHNTGTCLECKCGSDGRLTCSPNDCVSSETQDEMFMSRHQDSNSLDMFDVDMI